MTISQEKIDEMLVHYGATNYPLGIDTAAALTELKALRAQEPVAWRFRPKVGHGPWSLRHEEPSDPAQVLKIEPLFASPTLSTVSPAVTEDVIERAAEAAVNARIIPDSCQLTDYIDHLSAKDAVDLGVNLTEKTASGEPRFHGLSYIREDEWHEVLMAIARPMVRAALTAALQPGWK